MTAKTFTFAARSNQEPNKMATFTLQNDSVDVKLGNALLNQVEEALQARGKTDNRLQEWLKPVATGSLQRALQPFPIEDFDASMKDGIFETTAWLRAGGLRLVPISLDWPDVDNPAGADAFVNAVRQRQQDIDRTGLQPFDYWATWILIGLAWIALPIGLLLRHQMQKRRAVGSNS